MKVFKNLVGLGGNCPHPTPTSLRFHTTTHSFITFYIIFSSWIASHSYVVMWRRKKVYPITFYTSLEAVGRKLKRIIAHFFLITFCGDRHNKSQWQQQITSRVTSSQKYTTGVSSLGGPGMLWHPQILADQLNLSQPGRRGPPNKYWHPRIFIPSYDPVLKV